MILPIGKFSSAWAWAGVVLALQIFIESRGGAEQQAALFYLFGLSRIGISHGYWWEIFTYSWLHGSYFHAATNCLCLISLGTKVERIWGLRRCFMLLTSGIVMGGVSHLMLTPTGLGEQILVGVSGGCAALLLFLTTISPSSRTRFLPLSGRSLGHGVLLSSLLVALCNPEADITGCRAIGKWLVAHGLGSIFTISHACHFGGALAGLLAARWVLRPRVSAAALHKVRMRSEGG